MQIGTRLRCYPSRPLQATLWQWIGAQEFIYNAKTGEDRYFRAFARSSVALAGQYAPVDQMYSHFRAAERYQGYQRFFKKLAGRPGLKKRQGKRSVWITSELFRFPGVSSAELAAGDHVLEIGTAKHPVGAIPFYAHVPFRIPNSVHLSIEHGRWHLSFSCDDAAPEPCDEKTAAWLRQHFAGELEAMTVAFDRGVKAPMVGSDGSRLLNDAPVSKPVKRCGVTRKKQQQEVGAGCSELAEAIPPTLVEMRVRRARKQSGPGARQSTKRETPATARSA